MGEMADVMMDLLIDWGMDDDCEYYWDRADPADQIEDLALTQLDVNPRVEALKFNPLGDKK